MRAFFKEMEETEWKQAESILKTHLTSRVELNLINKADFKRLAQWLLDKEVSLTRKKRFLKKVNSDGKSSFMVFSKWNLKKTCTLIKKCNFENDLMLTDRISYFTWVVKKSDKLVYKGEIAFVFSEMTDQKLPYI